MQITENANELYKNLFTMNALIKKIPIDIPNYKAKYVVMNNTFIALDPDTTLMQVIAEMKFNKKNEFLEEYFEHEDFTFYIDSDEFFQFDKERKEAKLDVDKIVIENNVIEFFTSSSLLSFRSENPNVNKFDTDVEGFNEVLEVCENNEPLATATLNVEDVKKDEFKKSFWIVLDGNEECRLESFDYLLTESEYGILLRPKDILDVTAKTNITVSVYSLKGYYGIITLTLDATKFNATQYFKVLLV